MRTVAGIVVAALVGAVLAVVTSYAIVQANAPDRNIEAAIDSSKSGKTDGGGGGYTPREVVVYGQR